MLSKNYRYTITTSDIQPGNPYLALLDTLNKKNDDYDKLVELNKSIMGFDSTFKKASRTSQSSKSPETENTSPTAESKQPDDKQPSLQSITRVALEDLIDNVSRILAIKDDLMIAASSEIVDQTKISSFYNDLEALQKHLDEFKNHSPDFDLGVLEDSLKQVRENIIKNNATLKEKLSIRKGLRNLFIDANRTFKINGKEINFKDFPFFRKFLDKEFPGKVDLLAEYFEQNTLIFCAPMGHLLSQSSPFTYVQAERKRDQDTLLQSPRYALIQYQNSYYLNDKIVYFQNDDIDNAHEIAAPAKIKQFPLDLELFSDHGEIYCRAKLSHFMLLDESTNKRMHDQPILGPIESLLKLTPHGFQLQSVGTDSETLAKILLGYRIQHRYLQFDNTLPHWRPTPLAFRLSSAFKNIYNPNRNRSTAKAFFGQPDWNNTYNILEWASAGLFGIATTLKNVFVTFPTQFIPAVIRETGAWIKEHAENYRAKAADERNRIKSAAMTIAGIAGIGLGGFIQYTGKAVNFLGKRISSPYESAKNSYAYGKEKGGEKYGKALGVACAVGSAIITGVAYTGLAFAAALLVPAIPVLATIGTVAAATTAVISASPFLVAGIATAATSLFMGIKALGKWLGNKGGKIENAKTIENPSAKSLANAHRAVGDEKKPDPHSPLQIHRKLQQARSAEPTSPSARLAVTSAASSDEPGQTPARPAVTSAEPGETRAAPAGTSSEPVETPTGPAVTSAAPDQGSTESSERSSDQSGQRKLT